MIFPANPSDATMLTKIALESKAHWGYTAAQLDSWREDLTILPETFDSWRGSKFMSENEIAGFYLLNRVNARTCHLEFLFVRPKFIGKNIGKQLIVHAIASCSANSCEVLNVLSDPMLNPFMQNMDLRRYLKKRVRFLDGFYQKWNWSFQKIAKLFFLLANN